MRCALVLLAFLCPATTAHAQSAAFAFVLWGEGADGQPVAMARAVVERATTCPALQRASGAWQGMTPRQRPPGGHFRDVLVCETLYPMGEAAAVLVGDRRLELPSVSAATPRRVLVMGDSGCRGDLPTQAAALHRRRLHQGLAVRRHRRGREAAQRRPDHPCRRLQLPQHAARHGRFRPASPATTVRSRSRSMTPATSTTRTSPTCRSVRATGARTCRAARSPMSGRPGATISSFRPRA